MAIKKSELYSSLWSACDELRGGVEPALYKDYVLVLLFIKYVSDKFAGVQFAEITVPTGASFDDLVALKNNAEIGDKINKQILKPLADANKLGTLPDFNDAQRLGEGQTLVDKLSNLIAIFEDPRLNFSRNRAEHDDILGDAYEYLMRNFASVSGKSKGQFYTPSEVSRIMAAVLGISDASTTSGTTVYDPTCGSGSLLLKVGDAAGSEVTLYGQEIDPSTAALAQMNMILHGYPTAQLVHGNTIAEPKFREAGKLKTFDYAVSNPPFSDKRWSNGITPESDKHERFQHYGVPPQKQGDYAYMLHVVRSLKPTGKAAIILPHGVLFRGNAEESIRRNILRRGYIKAIIGLPANLFYGTGIPACIVVLDKEGAASREGIFMIDASGGFAKEGPKNRLREMDVHKIVDTFRDGVDIPGYARFVTMPEIESHDYNLNLPRHIPSNKIDDVHDIDAHLNGGIPDDDIALMDNYWAEFPSLKAELFAQDRDGYQALEVPVDSITELFAANADVTRFQKQASDHFEVWQVKVVPQLERLSIGIKPKLEIVDLGNGLLDHYEALPLINPYDIYQILMNYWDEVLSDDFYQIAAEGWKAEPHRVLEKVKSGKKKGEMKDIGWACDLLPKEVVVGRYFAEEQEQIDELLSQLETAQADLDAMEEEQSGDDGAFAEFDKVNKQQVSARLKEIKDEAEFADEQAALNGWLDKTKAIAGLKKQIKELDEALNTGVLNHYPKLSEVEIKELVIQNKWMGSLGVMIGEAHKSMVQGLISRLEELADRYMTPLPKLQKQADELSAKVGKHLQSMGFSW